MKILVDILKKIVNEMKTINLHEYTEFGKVCDIWNNSISDKNGLCEFVTNVIMNMNPFGM